MSQFRRILHPTDFSRASKAALARAVDLALDHKAELLLLHVLVPAAPYIGEDSYVAPALYTELEATARRDAEKAMAAVLRKLKASKINAKSLLATGTPYDQIVRIAKNRRADLIVIGTHGRTGISKFFMGSVASRVIALAHCPVLTVRAR
ncbi:MAG: universal stress protein [Deltaproteobacteria bacterium]|nr:universal stress protein [Deltaproteobacteria bacterium]